MNNRKPMPGRTFRNLATWWPGVVLATLMACVVVTSFRSVSGPPAMQTVGGSSPKKGFCTVTRKDGKWVGALQKLRVNWHYSWGPDLRENEPADVEFVPMIWGKWNCNEKTIHVLKQLGKEGKVHYLLGFNEPDGKDQANMTVREAIASWPLLMKTGLPLGSPACVHPDNDWMKAFMKEADSSGYRVDFITVHWYGSPDAAGFIRYLKHVHALYKRPIWITEFVVGDWQATSISNNRYTPSEILAFAQKVLPSLDTLTFVKRYAWYSARPDDPHLGSSALFARDGSLTPLGKYYRQQ